MNRIITLDVAKAICIILVVIGHYIPDNSPIWYVMLHDVIYTFHMPLFMFASGYIYIATKKNIGYGAFLWKKVKRLMIPYLTTSVLVITIKLFTQGTMSVDAPVSVMSYVRMFYLPEAGAFLWFIWALWWMFVIVPLLKTKRTRTLFFLICLVVHFVPMDLPREFCIAQCKHMFVYFMLGIFVFEHRLLQQWMIIYKPMLAILSVLLFCIFESWFVIKSIDESNLLILNAILPFLGIFFVVELSKLIATCCNKKIDALFVVISSSSYIIYLFHTTFEGFAKAVFRKLPFNSDLWYVFMPEALGAILAGILAPMILHLAVLKRWQLTRLLFGLGK